MFSAERVFGRVEPPYYSNRTKVPDNVRGETHFLAEIKFRMSICDEGGVSVQTLEHNEVWICGRCDHIMLFPARPLKCENCGRHLEYPTYRFRPENQNSTTSAYHTPHIDSLRAY